MKHIFLTLLCIVSLAGCHTYQSVTQTESGSFIQLKGQYSNAELVVDGQAPIVLDSTQKTFKSNGVNVMKFAVSQGTHHIQITKAGHAVVDRKIFVTEGNTFEIIVP
jgi:hypothetical protein